MKLYLERQRAQIALVKTNFSQMTADILFFALLGEEGTVSPIVVRVLDPILDPIVKQGSELHTPPVMPVFAEEVGFFFNYY